MNEIYLAGGCFWGVEAFFRKAKGVISAESGYANGNIENPTYEQVCNGLATHAEVVKIEYDDNIIKLEKILEMYFRIINPFSLNKQGGDVGIQYRTGIYYKNNNQKEISINYINDLQEKTTNKIVVEVLPLDNYYKAEEYHQDYLTKNPTGYCHVNLNLIKEEERK